MVDELHFGRAAARLNVVQPATSQQIRKLEKELGLTLLHRDRRGVALTATGEALLPRVLTVLDAVDQIADTARRLVASTDRRSASAPPKGSSCASNRSSLASTSCSLDPGHPRQQLADMPLRLMPRVDLLPRERPEEVCVAPDPRLAGRDGATARPATPTSTSTPSPDPHADLAQHDHRYGRRDGPAPAAFELSPQRYHGHERHPVGVATRPARRGRPCRAAPGR